MRLRYSGLTGIVLLVFLILLAQVASSYQENQAANVTDDGLNAAETDNNTTTVETVAATAQPNVQGIWKATIAGVEITMALNQSGDSLFGLAKSEGDDPWNGAVAGYLLNDEVQLSLASMPGKTLTSTYLRGTVKDDSIAGSYIKSDSSGKAAKGEFSASMILPDASGYTPAVVKAVQEPAPSVEQGSMQNASTAQGISSEGTSQKTKTKFYSVTELAKGINPNIMPSMAPL